MLRRIVTYFSVLCFAFILVLSLRIETADAQASSGITVSVPYSSPQVRVSPDNRTAAVYELWVMPLPGDDISSVLPVRLIDLTTGVQIGVLTGHTDLIVDGAFSSDGSQFITLHANGDIFVWTVATQQVARIIYNVTLPRQGGILDLSADGTIVGVTADVAIPVVDLWDISRGVMLGRYRQHFDAYPLFNEKIVPPFFHPAGLQLNLADGSIYVLATNLADSSEIYRWEYGDPSTPMLIWSGEYFIPRGFQLFDQGRRFAFIDANGNIRYLDTVDRQLSDSGISNAVAFAIGTNIIAWLSQNSSEMYIAATTAPEVFRSMNLELAGQPINTQRRPQLVITSDDKYAVFSSAASNLILILEL